MNVHPHGCECGKYACELRLKGVSISPAATPTSRNNIPSDNNRYNGYEKGKAYETRASGERVPILNKDGQLIPIKTYNEKYRKVHEETRQAQRASQP